MPTSVIPQPVDQLQVLDKEPENEGDAPIQQAPIMAKIPDSMWDPVKDEITTFVRHEIAAAKSERQDFERKLARWKIVYDTPMPEGPKTFPFFGASNLTLPVVKEAVNTLVAQLVQATLTSRPFWVLQDLAEEWEPFIDELETFLDIAGERELKIGEKAIPWIIEAAKYGTSVIEIGNDVVEKKLYQSTADGKSIYPKLQIMHDGPALFNMSLEDFFMRFGETDPQTSQWVGKRLRWNESTIRQQESIGRIEKGTWDAIKDKNASEDIPDPKEVQEEMEKTEPTHRLEWEFYQIWLAYDVDKKGKLIETVMYYSPDLDKIVGRQFHPYWHGKRPFIVLRYFPVENRFYGQGLCEMLEQIQAAISARFNQRSDNITLASLKVFLKRKGVRALQPGDPLYSGKVLEVMDVHNDIREMKIGEIYPSTVQEELMLRDYGERLSGINEAVIGSGSPVSRTTATAQMALLQEQAKRIDLTVRSIRAGINEIGSQEINLYFQFGVNGKALAWMGQRGRNVEAIFRLPKRIVELGLAVRAQVPTSLQNRQVKRENSLAMFNLLNTMYQQMIPLAQGLAPEALPDVVAAMVKGSQKFLGDVLETFDVSDPEEALAGLAVLEKLLPRSEDMGGLEAFSRGVADTEILDKLAGLDNILREAEALRGRDSGALEQRPDPPRLPPTQGVPSDLDAGIIFGGEPTIS